MKRSFFLSRRLHRHVVPRRFASRTRKHPRYHHTVSRPHGKYMGSHRRKQNKHRKSKKRGGAIGETVDTVEGIPVGKNVVVTDSKGVTRTLVKHDPLLNTETAEARGDDDV